MERELYHSNAMLGLNPLADDSEAMHFHFGKLTGDSKDFFNCDTPIGLDYPDRSALQPICVHFDSGDGTNEGEKADENVELLDISSKRLPVDLGFNGLDKTTIQINGNYTNNQLVVNSPPTSESGSAESNDYINIQCNDNYMRADYTNQASSVDNERVFYNNNLYYSNHYHEQPHDNLNHHQSHQIYHRSHLHMNHTTHQQNYHHIHYQNYQQQPSTPLHYYQHYQPQAKQQSFQRFHHRKHTPHKAPPKPIQKPPQSPPKLTKLVKHKQRQQTQTSTQVRTPPQPQPQLQPKPQSKSQAKVQPSLKRKHYRRNHIKALEEKPVLNQHVQKPKLGRPRKYNYSPPKPVKFRSNRLRLKVQSENLDSEQDSESIPESSKNLDEKNESKKEKEQEILPVEWDRPENLSFDRHNVSDFEKASLPEFFAGKYDRTHFHPSQYLQIRNIFLDEWESRKPNTVRFREMIRIHKGIGNVVSFSRVCKFLTAIGAINDVNKDDNIVNGNKDEDSCNLSLPSIEDNHNKVNDEESEEPKESLQAPSSSSSPSPSPSPPSLSSSIEANTLSPSATPSEDSMLQTAAPRPRRGRKRKSYFLNEMTRLGIDPSQAGFPIPDIDREKDSVQEIINETDDKSNEMVDLPESVQTSS